MRDIMLPSFTAQYGYKIKLCATDVVLACAAVLEGVVSELFSVFLSSTIGGGENCRRRQIFMFHFPSTFFVYKAKLLHQICEPVWPSGKALGW